MNTAFDFYYWIVLQFVVTQYVQIVIVFTNSNSCNTTKKKKNHKNKPKHRTATEQENQPFFLPLRKALKKYKSDSYCQCACVCMYVQKQDQRSLLLNWSYHQERSRNYLGCCTESLICWCQGSSNIPLTYRSTNCFKVLERC